MEPRARRGRVPAIVGLLGFVVAGCATAPEPVPEIRPGLLAGYLDPKQLLNSLALLPSPPAGSAEALENDEAISRASQTLRGTARYALAAADADLSFPRVAGAFACASMRRSPSAARPTCTSC